MTAEQKYDLAMEMARSENNANVAAFLSGDSDNSGPALVDLQRKYLIEAIGGTLGQSPLAVSSTTSGARQAAGAGR